ncbi:MAG: thioredoxin domain-containing protein [Hyphomicrobium sp.]
MRMSNWLKSLVVVAALAGSASTSFALEPAAYTADAVKAAQAAGKPVLIHVTAPWCPTCKAQHQAINTIIAKPEFAEVAVFNVDFDTQEDALAAYKTRTQSTLVAFHGDKETGRLVGETKPAAIEALIATSLKK